MDNSDFSLTVNMPEFIDEKTAKVVRSSLENLLNDYFTAFNDIVKQLDSKHDMYQCGTVINFDNGRSFQIIFAKKPFKSIMSIGMVDKKYGTCEKTIDFNDAVIINKYSLELSARIHEQRMAAYSNALSELMSIDGVYSTPKSGKTPIYKSKDSDYNFVDGPGRVEMRQNNCKRR